MKIHPGLSMSAILLFALTGSLRAQACHSLNGTWELNAGKSRFGGLKPPDMQAETESLSMQLSGTNLRQSFHYAGTQVKGDVSYSFAIDGATHALDNSQPNPLRPVSVKAEWQGCTLVMKSTVLFYGSSIDSDLRYYVSEDGRQLILLQYTKNLFLTADRRLVFDRK